MRACLHVLKLIIQCAVHKRLHTQNDRKYSLFIPRKSIIIASLYVDIYKKKCYFYKFNKKKNSEHKCQKKHELN